MRVCVVHPELEVRGKEREREKESVCVRRDQTMKG